MALSTKAKKRLEVAMSRRAEAAEVSARIDRQAANVTDISTADATDLPTALVLANATKAKVNALLAALRAAGLM